MGLKLYWKIIVVGAACLVLTAPAVLISTPVPANLTVTVYKVPT